MSTTEQLLPRGYPIRRRGSCVPAAYLILKVLGAGDMVSGYVGDYYDEHSWVEHDGKIIDPTIRQFRWWRAGEPIHRHRMFVTSHDDVIRKFEQIIKLAWSNQGEAYRRFVDATGQPITTGAATA